MHCDTWEIEGCGVPVYRYNTVVVGSGAAGFNAADRLWELGQHSVAMVTEGIKAGTSRNTGSDKQTYYKLTLSSQSSDSVGEMARTLFDGGCMDGDVALAEAALSPRCFMRLVELGVPFPSNRFGEYIGYKTDHDPKNRATSVGPLTSKAMTEALERSVVEKGISIYDGFLVIKILRDEQQVRGILCLDLKQNVHRDMYVLFLCDNVIYATGGPAGLYQDVSYPESQAGGTGIAFEAGAAGKNLTEWQFGLASVSPRWNVSGTYMQVLPRFVSTDQAGGDQQEFLLELGDVSQTLSKVFLKGYQWPFDVRKLGDGSSIIDLMVYLERGIKGRRVFLDFTRNPFGEEVDFALLEPEAFDYLRQAGAAFGTPFQRLLHMNAPAVKLYQSKGVDLSRQPLEIALCAQHNNGGLDVDLWWQSSLPGFFPVGEAAGTHGVYRPGGSALNAGQVGGLRAAQYIAAKRSVLPRTGQADTPCLEQAAQTIAMAARCRGQEDTAQGVMKYARQRMSKVGGAIRQAAAVGEYAREVEGLLAEFTHRVRYREHPQYVFRCRDMLLAQLVYLRAMEDYCLRRYGSRGSALYLGEEGLPLPEWLGETGCYQLDSGENNGLVQVVQYRDGACDIGWRKVRPIPEEEQFFENVWREYRSHGNVY